MKPLKLIAGMTLALVLMVGQALAGEVLLDFYSQSCAPCQQMAPIVDRLASAGYQVRKIDVDREPALAQQYGVTRLPTYILLSNSKPVAQSVGLCGYEQLASLFSNPPGARITPASLSTAGPRPYVVPVFMEGCDEPASGVYVGDQCGKSIVLTCRHVAEEKISRVGNARPIEVTFDKFGYDLAAVFTEPLGLTPVDIGDGAVTQGEQVAVCGFGGSKYAEKWGQTTGETSPESGQPWGDMTMTCAAIPGDSGGAVVNRKGRLVGILWGNRAGGSVAVCCPAIRAFMDRIKARGCGTPGDAPIVPVPPSVNPGMDWQPIIGRLDKIDSAVTGIGVKVDGIDKRVTVLENPPKTPWAIWLAVGIAAVLAIPAGLIGYFSLNKG